LESTPKPLARLSGFTPADWAEVERCSARSTDGASVQYFFMKPKGAGGRLPTLLWIHGGPIAWTRWMALAMESAAGRCGRLCRVLPNPRGSTGFGQDFIFREYGEMSGAINAQGSHVPSRTPLMRARTSIQSASWPWAVRLRYMAIGSARRRIDSAA